MRFNIVKLFIESGIIPQTNLGGSDICKELKHMLANALTT